MTTFGPRITFTGTAVLHIGSGKLVLKECTHRGSHRTLKGTGGIGRGKLSSVSCQLGKLLHTLFPAEPQVLTKGPQLYVSHWRKVGP